MNAKMDLSKAAPLLIGDRLAVVEVERQMELEGKRAEVTQLMPLGLER